MQPKSRLAYILLGVFLGYLGIHNFFAGYKGKAITQLLITLLSFGCLSFVSWIWSIIDICTVTKDAQGQDFAS
ncbi:MAG: TM2 domain-containing protein [Akkermansia sp.]